MIEVVVCMHKITDYDKRILHEIVSLTEAHNGRPPSLAEITLALGYPNSSRGNIQKQLVKLRPTYVDWGEGSRTLHVTQPGRAVLEIPISKDNDGFPIPDTVLTLIASGLTSLLADVSKGQPFHAPFPDAWQRGINMLAAECFLRNVDPPGHLHAAFELCRMPLKEWPVRFSLPSLLLDEALLDENNQPTSLCREYALTRCDAEQEACQKIMVAVLGDARHSRIPDAYVSFRQFLIEHPVVTEEELLEKSFDPQVGTLGSHFIDLYERVPNSFFEADKVLLCGFCGWTLQRTRGRLCCGDDRCRVLTGDFIQISIKTKKGSPGKLFRVRPAIRRYVVAPGIYEIGLKNRLEEMGIIVQLWPGFDAYDLQIFFSDDSVWAVDVKDWKFPHLLASHLTPLDDRGNLQWQRSFYAIPDQRIQEYHGYLDILQNAAAGNNFSVLSINDLIEEIHKYKERLHQ
ncbi:hypothetical protein KDW_31440 [Dictyobacter vulcani]|uniref:REase associating with pPIWI RE domain-containing protein n=2 Tax=Dictyobacter vulcani TaxID=2607529 RepID=A0A5J4KPA5_9CHLR|nr:hypothetical protein KDW_31440 [Dictyobacter vulcani]